MKTHCTTWIFMLLFLLPLTLAAQENLKVKDQNGNVLLEAREDGILIRKMTTAERIVVAGLDSDDNGLMVYDTDTKSIWLWHDTEWIEIDGIDMVNDADHDPTNELQDWSTLPGIPSGFSDGTDNVIDPDADPTNELQNWGNLPGIPSGFSDGTDNVDDGDSDPTNELQDWSTLPGIPSGFSDGTDNVDDADADPTNETNSTLQLNGTVLKIMDSGGTLTTDLSSLKDDLDWMVDEDKVYNTGVKVGIGTDAPGTGLHVKGNKGAGEFVMLIENENHAGSGLQIRIDGSHPLWVTGEGGDPDFFVTHPGSSIVDVFEPLANDIRTYLMNNGSLDMSDIDFSQIASPGGMLDQLGLVDLVSGGICKGAETLVSLVNGVGLESITLPNLPLDAIPMDLPNVPFIPEIPTVPNFSVNPPPWEVCGILGNCYGFDIPGISVSSSFINTPINTFNNGIDVVNTGISSVNTGLETGYDNLKDGLMLIDGLEIPLPQLQVPQSIGPITCPNPNPWDDFSFSFESLNPLDYNIVNPLSSENAFITFSDQYNNTLGAITAQGLGEFSQDYFDQEKVLEIGSHVTGLFSDDGNIVENLISLGKDATAYYKATDKIGVLYSSGHGDYAEWLEREDVNEQIGYGDIIGIHGGKISLSVANAEQVMVVSKAPIVLGNIPEPGKEKNGNNLAFIGQVPVKVMGPVMTGDFIIANPSTPGYGIAIPEKEITPYQMALAVGKSWETNSTPGFKFVNTIVGMHNNGWATPVTKLQQQINAQETAIAALTARLDNIEYGNSLVADRKKVNR